MDGSTLTWSFISSNLAESNPQTSRNCSLPAKPPIMLRYFTIRFANEGPMPRISVKVAESDNLEWFLLILVSFPTKAILQYLLYSDRRQIILQVHLALFRVRAGCNQYVLFYLLFRFVFQACFLSEPPAFPFR